MKKSCKSERLIAAFFDLFVYVTFLIVINGVALAFYSLNTLIAWMNFDFSFHVNVNREFYAYSLWTGSAAFVFVLIYYVMVPTFRNGQTLGKRWVGVKVIDLKGRNPSFPIHLLRAIVVWSTLFAFPFIILMYDYPVLYGWVDRVLSYNNLLIVISLFLIWLTPMGRGLHDYLFKTMVVIDGYRPSNDFQKK